MCGIVGFSGCSKVNDEVIPIMLESIGHRGPDDKGVLLAKEGCLGLGHVRLSIIDTSISGHQPMYSSSKRFVIVFNGKVYNFQELKKYISDKYGLYSWKSLSDTEVIVEGYACEGKAFINKLNGVFALAIYDVVEGCLFLARDITGVKPLYYTNQNGIFYFASELKALLKLGLSRTFRQESLYDQLLYMYVPEPYTLFQEYFKFKPGEYRVYKDGVLKDSGFLDYSYHQIDNVCISESDYIEQLDYLFEEAVKRQLVSDVPVSLFLSGGLDSSLVSAVALQKGAQIKDAYTISCSKEDDRWDKSPSDDLSYAKRVADRLGIKLNVFEARMDMLELLPKVVYHLDDALSDPAAINTYLICKSACENGIRVMLSGQGADEILGGYRRYRAELLYRKIPRSFLKYISPLEAIIPASVPGPMNTVCRHTKKFLQNAIKSGDTRIVELSMWKNPLVVRNLFLYKTSFHAGTVHLETLNKFKNRSPLESMMRMDEELYLPSHNLMYTDKMSMMAGVEARVPFLDLPLLDFIHHIPIELKIKNNVQKYILKKMAERYLPTSIIYRPKAGFSSPIRSWFRQENELMRRYFDTEFLSRQGVFDPSAVRLLLLENLSGKSDNAYLLYALLNFQIWYDIFINKNEVYN